MGKAKKVGGNTSSILVDKSKPSLSSKVSKAKNVKDLGIFGSKKIIQERGIDLNSCDSSYVYKVLMDRKWGHWIDMLGVSNETMVREFYHVYKGSSTVISAILDIREVVFRVCARKGELTKISAFWHLFVCSNLVGSTNASELNRNKIKIVYALVTNKPINLGELLVEQIEIAVCTSRLDKKLAFPGFITQLCLAKEVRNLDDDVMLPSLEKLSEKRVATMSYKDKGKSSDVFRLFDESLDSSHVPSSPALPSWALKLRNEVEESRRLIEVSQRKIEDISAKLVVQDERIKELEGKSNTTKQYVRSSHRTTFLGGTSG
ncbi:hypothetical protein LWI29_023780 [Acer saccharum]|uniref:Putative plant transposon protein domain-containing protein n=1 Tax=Acer saccharum TaxID=4024 RepID=A0AA39T225_ACESA|nr:hypothetical protein LWI29_023780 [Acer saccharum]